MRSGAPTEVLAGSCGWECRVWPWLGPSLLSPTPIPIVSGRLVVDVTARIPERLTLTVPRWDGRDWRPGDDPRHPLARYGQELQVSIVVSAAIPVGGSTEWETRVGRYLITGWNDGDDGLVRVSAIGRTRRLLDARLPAPSQPAPGATLASEARRLMPAGVSLGIDSTLVDRACPAGMLWNQDRLSALQEIADAWPARLRTDEWGQVRMLPPLPDVPAPVFTVTDGERGTVVSAPRSDMRDGSYNQVVATSSAAGSPGVYAVAEVASGPMAVGGEYGPVSTAWSSPLVTSVSQAHASAQTILARSTLPARRVTATIAPDPRPDLDDAVSLVRDGDATWGWVVGYDLPLTVGDGAMRLDVGVRS